MPTVRRTPYAFYYLDDAADPPILALAILTGEQHRLDRRAFELLMSLPADRWADGDGIDPAALGRLTDMGLVLQDPCTGPAAALRARDEALSANQWNLYAALYHFMTQWRGMYAADADQHPALVKEQSRAVARAFVAAHGPPPGEFAELPAGDQVALPDPVPAGPLFDALTRRRTTRAFDTDTPLTADELGTVLRYVFGCHGYGRNVADVVCIKRTSPSGGGLHPIEVYPIVADVVGLDPGIYHYNVRDHALAPVSPLGRDEARRLATAFMCGQSYFAGAAVSFVMTARFYRNHWKYRRHQKAYAGILMDAAHLSQTLYLVAGELGLGAFITLAINARDIEQRLGLDGVGEGVIAMCGCGHRAPGPSPLELRFAPSPGEV